MIDDEAGLLVQLGDWHTIQLRLDAARAYAADALYEWGIRQARENLEAVAKPEPADLPAFRAGHQPSELGIVPTSPIEALALQPPLSDDILRRIIPLLERDEGLQALQRGLSESAWSPEIRAAAIARLRELNAG